jgi:steroid delta-isomerase-like uncharacterized protein
MTTGETIFEVLDETTVRTMFDTFNDRAAFFANPTAVWIDEPHYVIHPQQLEMTTRAEVVAWFSSFFDAFPDLHMAVEDVAIDGDVASAKVAVRWLVTGTFSGAPYQGIEPTGAAVEMRGMDLIQIQDGRIAGNQVNFDQMAFAAQIGLLPAADSRAAAAMTAAMNAKTKLKRKLYERRGS